MKKCTYAIALMAVVNLACAQPTAQGVVKSESQKIAFGGIAQTPESDSALQPQSTSQSYKPQASYGQFGEVLSSETASEEPQATTLAPVPYKSDVPLQTVNAESVQSKVASLNRSATTSRYLPSPWAIDAR